MLKVYFSLYFIFMTRKIGLQGSDCGQRIRIQFFFCWIRSQHYFFILLDLSVFRHYVCIDFFFVFMLIGNVICAVYSLYMYIYCLVFLCWHLDDVQMLSRLSFTVLRIRSFWGHPDPGKYRLRILITGSVDPDPEQNWPDPQHILFCIHFSWFIWRQFINKRYLKISGAISCKGYQDYPSSSRLLLSPAYHAYLPKLTPLCSPVNPSPAKTYRL